MLVWKSVWKLFLARANFEIQMCNGGCATSHTHTLQAQTRGSMASSVFKCCQSNWKTPSEDRKSFSVFLALFYFLFFSWYTNFASFKVALIAVGKTFLLFFFVTSLLHLWYGCRQMVPLEKNAGTLSKSQSLREEKKKKPNSSWPDFRWSTTQWEHLSIFFVCLFFF